MPRTNVTTSRAALFAAALALCAPRAGAQPVPTPAEAVLSGLGWRYVGPAIAGGRVTDIEVVPGDAETRHIGKVVVHPTDPRTVWVGPPGPKCPATCRACPARRS